MAQVTIYLDDEHEKKLREAARDAGVPVSRWIAGLIERHTRTQWPESVRESAGNWPDAPEPTELRNGVGHDVPREPL